MRKKLVAFAMAVGVAQAPITASANNEFWMTLLGTGTGVAIGSHIGKGRGNTAAMVGLGVVGAMLGNSVGRKMDRAEAWERSAFQNAFSEAKWALQHTLNTPGTKWVHWKYSQRGYFAEGGFKKSPAKGYHFYDGVPCRAYKFYSEFNGEPDQGRGVACKYGKRWEVMHGKAARDVVFDRGPRR